MVVLDTNVVLDALLERPGLAETARPVIRQVELGGLQASLCATTITTLDYFLSRHFDAPTSRRALRELLRLFNVAQVDRSVIDSALASDMSDFEDAVLAHAAQAGGAHAIVTRNLRDFAASPVRAYTPEQWLAIHP